MDDITFVNYKLESGDHVTLIYTTVGDLEMPLFKEILSMLPMEIVCVVGEEIKEFVSKQHPTSIIYRAHIELKRKMWPILSRFNRYEWVPHLTAAIGIYKQGDKIPGKLEVTTTKYRPEFASHISRDYVMGLYK